MGRILRWFIFLVIVGSVIAVSIPAMTWIQEKNKLKYVTVTVSRGRVETVVNSTGTVKPVRTVSFVAFTSGPIAEIYVDFNSEITKKDQVLALIDPKLMQAAVDRDRAAGATQEADMERIKALLDQ